MTWLIITANFFLANADISLRSKSETAWGKDIPEEVFLHYVLPCRIKVILNCNHLIKISSEYYIHFTLARFEGGQYNTLEYDFNRKITDFKEELPLPPGHYMLVTGNRLDNSKILSDIFFELLENEHRTVIVQIRKDVTEKKVLGNIALKMIDSLFHLTKSSESCINDKGIAGNGRDHSPISITPNFIFVNKC